MSLDKKYPLIYKYIIPIKNSNDPQKYIGLYTSKLKKDEQKLQSWLEYWSNKDLNQALNILVSIEEKYEPIVFDKLKNQTIDEQIYYYILYFLKKRNFKKAEIFYAIVSQNHLLSQINDQDIKKLQALYETITNESFAKIKNEAENFHIDEVLNKITNKNEQSILKTAYHNFLQNAPREIETNEELITNITTILNQKNLVNAMSHLTSILDKALNNKLDAKSLNELTAFCNLFDIKLNKDDIINIFNNIYTWDFLKKYSLGDFTKELNFRGNYIHLLKKIILKEPNLTDDEKQILINLLKQNASSKNIFWYLANTHIIKNILNINYNWQDIKVNLIKINKSLANTFQKTSDYQIILSYIKILVTYSRYAAIAGLKSNLKYVDKQANKEIIKEISSIFVSKNEIPEAFHFLYNLNIKNYLEYLPTSTKTTTYIEKLKNSSYFHPYLIIQIIKELFKTTLKDQSQFTQKWFAYIDENIQEEDKIVAKQITLFEIFNQDLTLLDNDNYYTGELKKLQITPENNKKNHYFYTPTLINLLNAILNDENPIARIKKLGKANLFAKNFKNDIYYHFLDANLSSLKNESISITKKIWPNQSLEDKFFIYTNTHIKQIISLEKILSEFDGNEKIKEAFQSFPLYGYFKTKKSLSHFNRLKITNVKTTNRILLYTKLKVELNAIYECQIIGYNKFNNDILITIVNEKDNQDENIYTFPKETKKEILNAFELKLKYQFTDNENNLEQLLEKNYSLEKTIDLFYNSILKINNSLNDLIINLLTKYSKEEIIKQLQKYPIYFKNSNQKRIASLINKGTFIYNGNIIDLALINGFTIMKCQVCDYSKEKNEIIVTNISSTNFFVKSSELTALEKICDNYLLSQKEKELEKLKTITKMPELELVNIYENKKNLLLNTYITLSKKIIFNLVHDLNKLKQYLENNEQNNYFNIFLNTQVTTHDKTVAEVFLKKTREYDIKTILYCYGNTYLKYIIPLNELLKKIIEDKKGIILLNKIIVRDQKVQNNIYKIGEYSLKINNVKSSYIKIISYDFAKDVFNCENIFYPRKDENLLILKIEKLLNKNIPINELKDYLKQNEEKIYIPNLVVITKAFYKYLAKNKKEADKLQDLYFNTKLCHICNQQKFLAIINN